MNNNDNNIFNATTKTKIGKTEYIVERRFGNSRSVVEAIYEAVKNEAVRCEKTKKE